MGAHEAGHSCEYPARPIIGVGTVVWHGERVLLVQLATAAPGPVEPARRRAAAGRIADRGGPPRGPRGDRVAVDLGEVIATVDLIERDPQGRVRYHYTLIDFTAEAHGAELVPGDDAADARWFELDQIGGLGLRSETLRIIELARAGRCR